MGDTLGGGHVPTVEVFVADRWGDWRELRDLVRLGRDAAPHQVLRAAALRDAVRADAGLAATRYAGDGVAAELAHLCAAADGFLEPSRGQRARAAREAGLRSVVAALRGARGVPVVRWIGRAALGFLAVGLLAAVWGLVAPGSAESVLPLAAREVPDAARRAAAAVPRDRWPTGVPGNPAGFGLGDALAQCWTALLGGVTAGVVTLWRLVASGLDLGVGAGLALRAGRGAAALSGMASGAPRVLALVTGAGAGASLAGVAGRVLTGGGSARPAALAELRRRAGEALVAGVAATVGVLVDAAATAPLGGATAVAVHLLVAAGAVAAWVALSGLPVRSGTRAQDRGQQRRGQRGGRRRHDRGARRP
jgi:hypothetical protein